MNSDAQYCLDYLAAKADDQPVATDFDRLLLGVRELRRLAKLGVSIEDAFSSKKFDYVDASSHFDSICKIVQKYRKKD